MSNNVQRFIALQIEINNQINTVGQADAQLIGEMDYIGDQLNDDEIYQVAEICEANEWFTNQHDKHDDIKWMID